jgi:hypothetical protein
MSEVLTSLQRQILGYLRDNVHAAETVEGINSAWLQRSPTAAALQEIEQALLELVRRGSMERYELPGGAALYRKSRAR